MMSEFVPKVKMVKNGMFYTPDNINDVFKYIEAVPAEGGAKIGATTAVMGAYNFMATEYNKLVDEYTELFKAYYELKGGE